MFQFGVVSGMSTLARLCNLLPHYPADDVNRFSKAAPGTGLHARPHPPAVLQKLVPDMPLHPSYDATYHPNREGESMEELQERTDTFVEAFVRRIDAEYPDAKTIVVVSHAGLVITMGRAVSHSGLEG